MADEERAVIVPIEQATVTFYDRPIVAVRLPDGRIAAVLNTLCEALQLAPQSQVRRIRNDEVLADQLVVARVETPGGPQSVDVLTAWAIPSWLQGIQPGRVAPEKRPAILAFRREAADVLYRHFAQRRPALPEPSALVPAEPIAEPAKPAPDAAPLAWAEYHEQMALWLRWQADVERWRRDMEQRQGALEQRMEAVEEVARLVPDLIERLGPPMLTPEHQRTVQAGVNRLHDLTHRAHAAIYDELRQAFRVGTYKDIPEDRWQEVAAWFRERIARAGGRQGRPPEQGSLF
jgi:hypothetical protein